MNSFIKLFLLLLSIHEAISNNEGSLEADGNTESYETRIKKSIFNNMPLTWTFPIDYHVGPYVDRNTIKAALVIMERETCIRFNETSTFTKGGINYVYSTQCVSFIGKVTRTIPQDIGLTRDCNKATIILHETSHALGVIHEMTRHDRDSYIDIKFGNINPRSHHNFQIYNLTKASPLGLKYDFGSVMQYDRTAGSANRQLAMEPKISIYLKTIGQTTRFGFNDAKQLNIHYCSDRCPKSKLKCNMGGYPDPNKCTVCKCPEFYTGKLCQKLLPSNKECGPTKFKTKTLDKELKADGIKTCYFQIKAPIGRKIELKIETNLADNNVCQPDQGLEVKFFSDKAVSGAMLCGRINEETIISEDNLVVMKYVGLTQNSKVKIKYREI